MRIYKEDQRIAEEFCKLKQVELLTLTRDGFTYRDDTKHTRSMTYEKAATEIGEIGKPEPKLSRKQRICKAVMDDLVGNAKYKITEISDYRMCIRTLSYRIECEILSDHELMMRAYYHNDKDGSCHLSIERVVHY